jgi:mono/diheme cytochrome c family protein
MLERASDNSRMMSALQGAAAVLGALCIAGAAGPLTATLPVTNARLEQSGEGQAAGRSGASPDAMATAARVRRLLSDRCFRCHGPDATKRKAKLRLDTRDGLFAPLDDNLAVVTPGDLVKSELIRRTHLPADDEDVMPPADAHQALTAEERGLLARWVTEGATYRGHWSWEPIAAPAVPVLTAASDAASTPRGGARPGSATNPIDGFVRARLAGEGLSSSPRAAPDVLLRRLSFNLTGLPPTTAELDALLANPSPAGYGRAVDRLLASPAYGERMASEWLDLARYADTYGYQADVTRDMSPYRDWVISAFNRNLPYDQFLTWQLAGDLLPNATREQRIATAFNRLHRQTNEGGSIEEEFRTEYVADRVNTFGTAMLGLTLECARCHDHKFDAITQRDYFSLFAFFNSIDESGLYSHFTNATPSPSLLLWPAHGEAVHADVQRRIMATQARLTALSSSADAAWHAWRASQPAIVSPAPIAHLGFDTVSGDTTPDSASAATAALQDGPMLVGDGEASHGKALRFSGDNAVVLTTLREFSRTDAFSIAVRLKPTETQPRAVVLHQSRAWSDAGSRGFELTLDDGRPFFGVIHFWPGNAVAVRAREPLRIGVWSSVAVTYDGSSRASGMALYVDGVQVPVDVVRDHLYKDIRYDKDTGDLQTKPTPLTLGARFRDSGFKNGLMDDLRVYDVALTAAEVAGGRHPDALSRAHFLARVHEPSLTVQRELHRLRVEENRLIARVPEIMVMEELPEPRPTHRLARGSYDAPQEMVPRATPASLPAFPDDQPRNRLGLARWLTNGRHPLTARVAVNRIWAMHFGRGLVASLEDFGSQGQLPTHPELLDWLATRFIASGWDVKALHRLIVTSETFGQDSHASPDLTRRDPDNRLLARGPAMRLPAEAIRDGALAASGLLVRTVGGPSVKPYQPEGLWEQSGTGQRYVQDTGDKLHRRSLYTFWRRTSPPPSMTTFDAVSREVCVARREVTATPLQSLVLLNDVQFVEAARVLADQLVRRHPDDPTTRHRDAFRRLTGRLPDARETAILAQAFAEQLERYRADAATAEQVLAVGDAPRDRRLPAPDVAATTMVTSLIMNFEAFVVTR